MISDIFVPIPGVSSIDSAGASMSACIERKRCGEVAPGDLADLLEADGEEQALERLLLRALDGLDRALRGQLAIALELHELLGVRR